MTMLPTAIKDLLHALQPHFAAKECARMDLQDGCTILAAMLFRIDAEQRSGIFIALSENKCWSRKVTLPDGYLNCLNCHNSLNSQLPAGHQEQDVLSHCLDGFASDQQHSDHLRHADTSSLIAYLKQF